MFSSYLTCGEGVRFGSAPPISNSVTGPATFALERYLSAIVTKPIVIIASSFEVTQLHCHIPVQNILHAAYTGSYIALYALSSRLEHRSNTTRKEHREINVLLVCPYPNISLIYIL